VTRKKASGRTRRPVKISLIANRVARAKTIRTRTGLNWAALIQRWAALNALYGHEHGVPEERRLMDCIAKYFAEDSARRLLSRYADEASELIRIPPGDMRYESDHPSFRRRASEHASEFADERKSAVNRLAHLAAIMYQVRSNAVHGDKTSKSTRDRKLFAAVCEILGGLVPALEDAMQTT
jgi:hypothetical protein